MDRVLKVLGYKLHFFAILVLLAGPTNLFSQDKFYNYYTDGLKFAKKGDWSRSLVALQSAASLEFEDTNKKRTYGTRFIKYFPHREMGVAYYNLGEYENARKELDLSIAYKKSKRTKEYLNKLSSGEEAPAPKTPQPLWDQALAAALGSAEIVEELAPETIPAKPAEDLGGLEPIAEPAVEVASEPAPLPTTETPAEPLPITVAVPSVTAPAVSALTPILNYDPSSIIQVGSRLSIAVLPFVDKGESQDLGATISEVLVAELVAFRRFKVIERAAMETFMVEQDLAMMGMVEEGSAAQAGKMAGADVIIMGSIHLASGYSQISMRLIDTETGETIAAHEAQIPGADLRSIQQLIKRATVLIYNDLPLMVGYIVNVDADQVYLDLGSAAGIRRGFKFIAYTEGDPIVHPVTGEVLGSKVTKLGELLVVQVQERLSVAKLISDEGATINVGDRVVTK